jgi:hypothetical protein
MFTALKVPRQCPLVLLVTNAGSKQHKAMGRKESSVMGSGLLGVCSRGEKLRI